MNCSQKSYDHRLRDLVHTAGDADVIAEFGVPRSTAAGWLRGNYAPVVGADVLDMDKTKLQAEVLKLRQRVRRLAAIVRLLLAPQLQQVANQTPVLDPPPQLQQDKGESFIYFRGVRTRI